jgi:hypothetical protein
VDSGGSGMPIRHWAVQYCVIRYAALRGNAEVAPVFGYTVSMEWDAVAKESLVPDS